MGYPIPYNSLSLNQHSPRSIPTSQTTNYYNQPAEHNEPPLFETPETSQEDQMQTDQIETPDQMSDDELSIDEADEIAAIDYESGKLINNSAFITPNDSGKKFAILNYNQLGPAVFNHMTNKILIVNHNTKLGKNMKSKGKYDAVHEINDENKFKSMGKSEQMLYKLEAGQGNYTQLNDPHSYRTVKSVGKSDHNFENNGHLVQPINNSFGKLDHNFENNGHLVQPINNSFGKSDHNFENNGHLVQPINNSFGKSDHNFENNGHLVQPINNSFGNLIVQSIGKELGADPFPGNPNSNAVYNVNEQNHPPNQYYGKLTANKSDRTKSQLIFIFFS